MKSRSINDAFAIQKQRLCNLAYLYLKTSAKAESPRRVGHARLRVLQQATQRNSQIALRRFVKTLRNFTAPRSSPRRRSADQSSTERLAGIARELNTQLRKFKLTNLNN